MYKLIANYYSNDTGHFTNNLIAISENIDKLKSKAIEVADKNAQQGHSTPVWLHKWVTEVSSENETYHILNLGHPHFDDSYIISKETPL